MGQKRPCCDLCQGVFCLCPKHTTRKLLDLINEFSKVAEYKINIQKSVAFLYTNNELSEREIMATIPFTITSKRMKYLGINLTKVAKEIYSEIYKTLMKEIEDKTKRWKDIPCSWTGRINFVKMTLPPKAIYRFSAIPIKIPKHLHRTWKSNFKICIEAQRPQIAKQSWERTELEASRTLTSDYTAKWQ